MSHWTVAKVALKNPDMTLLRRALQIIADKIKERYGIRYGDISIKENVVITGWQGSKLCQLALTMDLPYGNGYGIYLDSEGNVQVFVDDHGAPMKAEEFAQELTKYYTMLAVAEWAQNQGYMIQDIQESEDNILIDVVTG